MENTALLNTEMEPPSGSSIALDEEALYSYYNALPIEQVRAQLNELLLEIESMKGDTQHELPL